MIFKLIFWSLFQQPPLTGIFIPSWCQVLPQALITRRNARAIPHRSASKVLSSLNNNCTLSLSGSLFVHDAWAKPRPLSMTLMGWLGEWRAVFLLPPVPQMQVLPRSTWAGPGGSAPLVSYRQSWEVQWHWPAHAGCAQPTVFTPINPSVSVFTLLFHKSTFLMKITEIYTNMERFLPATFSWFV